MRHFGIYILIAVSPLSALLLTFPLTSIMEVQISLPHQDVACFFWSYFRHYESPDEEILEISPFPQAFALSTIARLGRPALLIYSDTESGMLTIRTVRNSV